MKCNTPDCIGEHAPREVSHQVVYRERTVIIHGLPADVCPDCGDIVLSEETTIHLDGLLKAKARSKSTVLTYECG
jgi:YgiT-type zinc finger domain-containing protein